MNFLDERLVGSWSGSAVGAMEASGIAFLPDGRGWSRFDSVSGELAVARFRWHCPTAGRLALRYTWRISGEWGADTEGFAAVRNSSAFEEVLETGYRIDHGRPPLYGPPGPTLLLDDPVEFEDVFHRSGGRGPVTPADDPSAARFPYEPSPRPVPGPVPRRRTGS
ncbi:hypothetical protein [Streptomyces sp. NPDC089799]|uniref:hypothetical protein n=1 Tax=Streptomyces sp. NPDC089799 TaxID=3155066 RepID=UPI003428238B